MKQVKIFVTCFLVLFLALGVMAPVLWAAGEFRITPQEMEGYKKFFDDPRPYLKDLYKKVMPPEVYSKVTYDIEEMKKLWAEAVGFRAPDEVGKIAPDIKPGTYSYKDKDKYPGLKELMIPMNYENFFKPGGPPLAGCYPEIKVVPTRQYFWALPIGKATKENMGRTQLDGKGFIKEETYTAGLPFPRPEGKFKANQIYYNWMKRYFGGESYTLASHGMGFTRSLKIDNDIVNTAWILRFQGRVLLEPYGWYDERAKKMGEDRGFNFYYEAPRDMFGDLIGVTKYLDPDKYDQMLLYINAIRRVRVMSATDIQDQIGGADNIYVDSDIVSQKLSEKLFPYKVELIAEREYLIPFASWDGSMYMSSKGVEFHNIEFERRPMYVLKMTQLDKNFVYSYRILYIDKETFMLHLAENYDQKGRLYRTEEDIFDFIPEMGMFGYGVPLSYDHLDKHTTILRSLITPAPWVSRKELSLGGLVTKGK